MADTIGKTSYLWKCSSCHGEVGGKSALGHSKPIKGVSASLTIDQLNKYKAGKLNKYGFGGLMKCKLSFVNDKEIKNIAKYLETVK